jgi:hypothetical protein
MKGIYLTEESKKYIEDKIAELSKYDYKDDKLNGQLEGDIYRLKEILSSATILPVEESWKIVIDIYDPKGICNKYYPLGVIIQPKQ